LQGRNALKPALDRDKLLTEAETFSARLSAQTIPSLYGVTDGKAVGTFVEHGFKAHLAANYDFVAGSSASGIDLPELGVDIKVTSVTQPQSSCPFKSARQKIFGLGYALLVFVYSKADDAARQAATLNILHTVFVEKERTADYTLTKNLNQVLSVGGNADDLVASMRDRLLPVDETEAYAIAGELLEQGHIEEGLLGLESVVQRPLYYSRAITKLSIAA
jgi:thioredoxin-like negative regulator of GroEL